MARAQRRSQKPGFAYRSATNDREIEKFSALAQEWWDPNGSFAPLHALNPLRLAFIRCVSAQRFKRNERALAPFEDLSLIDIGCGGGLLAEPLARQGFVVLGIDAGAESIAAARVHAGNSCGSPVYRHARAEDLAREKQRFDVVLAMEIVEHVDDRESFLENCAVLLKPGGILFVATIARTMKALALAKLGAEYLLRWVPPGTHDWNKFVSPRDLSTEIETAGLKVLETQGVSFDPLGWRWRLSTDTDVNYMLAAAKPRSARSQGQNKVVVARRGRNRGRATQTTRSNALE
jgi:2-polyprenyl-6-hydroxyphenyl methylase/3-demethylubiquinone-9 3-methyltransferase